MLNNAIIFSRSSISRHVRSVFDKHWTRKINRLNFVSGLGDSAWLLYGICRSFKPSIAVEIGSARGKSTCYIGMALKENGIGRLYAVDPHTSTNWNDSDSVDTYDILRRHLGELNLTEVVSIVRQSSVEALSGVPKPIDFLFIDGDHSYEGVKSDWQLFTPHMTAFGVVVFHDTTWDLRPESKWFRADMGVPRFIDELRRQGYPVLTIDRDYGVSMVQPSIGGVSLSPQNSSASL